MKNGPVSIFAYLGANTLGSFVNDALIAASIKKLFGNAFLRVYYHNDRPYKVPLMELVPHIYTKIATNNPKECLPIEWFNYEGVTPWQAPKDWYECQFNETDFFLTPSIFRSMKSRSNLINLARFKIPETLATACESYFDQIGVKRDRWFACIYVRENGWKYGTGKDSVRSIKEPQAYYRLAEYIVRKLGGQVVRLGAAPSTSFPGTPGLFDLSRSTVEDSVLLQAFALSRCRFFITSDGGLLNLGVAFNVPMAATNIMSDPGILNNCSRILIKTLISSSRRITSYKKAIDEDLLREDIAGIGYMLEENSPEELCSVSDELFSQTSDCTKWRIPEEEPETTPVKYVIWPPWEQHAVSDYRKATAELSGDDAVLATAREFLLLASKTPFPDKFVVGSWWLKFQERIETFKLFNSREEAVLFAQNDVFDHRIHDRQAAYAIVNFKLRELEEHFPNYPLKNNLHICESTYSNKESLIDIDGINYSSIFLTHLSFYLRCAHTFDGGMNRVIEIGGGYGSTARIFKLMHPKISYTIIDLPESLFFAHCYLTLNFPNARVAYAHDNTRLDPDEFDFVLVPVQHYFVLKDRQFDVVINTGSLQEMPAAAVDFWMRFIQEFIGAKMFYSFNYFFVNKAICHETSNEESNLICPVLDPYWHVEYFKINPEVITIDANKRNWLEVCLKRIPRDARNFDVTAYAQELFRNANKYPKGSNYWFQNIWMAIWCKPEIESVSEMIEGIELFRTGRSGAVPRNNYLAFDENDSLYEEYKKFGEDRYYRELLEKAGVQ